MRCIAVIMVHNGVEYVDRCIQHLSLHQVDAAILDHGSTDGTYERCLRYVGAGVCHVGRVPYRGIFSLAEQLQWKQALLAQLDTDWVIHQDIDECLEPPAPFNTLLEWVVGADGQGFDALNFNEFVFIPHDSPTLPYHQAVHYYFFQPFAPRLMRAWKKGRPFSNLATGGHRLSGDVCLFPQAGHLRHYIFTDQAHAYRKYADRQFAADELGKGWHRNRVGIPLACWSFPAKNRLECLPSAASRDFFTGRPWKKHYWQTE